MDLLLTPELIQRLDALPSRVAERVASALDEIVEIVETDPRSESDQRSDSGKPSMFEHRLGAIVVPYMVMEKTDGETVAIALQTYIDLD